jgi:hypothetical protein
VVEAEALALPEPDADMTGQGSTRCSMAGKGGITWSMKESMAGQGGVGTGHEHAACASDHHHPSAGSYIKCRLCGQPRLLPMLLIQQAGMYVRALQVYGWHGEPGCDVGRV